MKSTFQPTSYGNLQCLFILCGLKSQPECGRFSPNLCFSTLSCFRSFIEAFIVAGDHRKDLDHFLILNYQRMTACLQLHVVCVCVCLVHSVCVLMFLREQTNMSSIQPSLTLHLHSLCRAPSNKKDIFLSCFQAVFTLISSLQHVLALAPVFLCLQRYGSISENYVPYITAVTIEGNILVCRQRPMLSFTMLARKPNVVCV